MCALCVRVAISDADADDVLRGLAVVAVETAIAVAVAVEVTHARVDAIDVVANK